MGLKGLFSKWTQAQVDAAMADARPLPPDPPGFSINAQNVHIGDVHNHAAKAEPERISEAQSRLLKAMVGKIGRLERAGNPAYNDARTWSKVNVLVGVDHHRNMLKRDFDRAKGYLEGWLRRLEG